MKVYYPGYCETAGSWAPAAGFAVSATLSAAAAFFTASHYSNPAEPAAIIAATAATILTAACGTMLTKLSHGYMNGRLSHRGIGITDGGKRVRRVQELVLLGPTLLGMAFNATVMTPPKNPKVAIETPAQILQPLNLVKYPSIRIKI